MSFANFDEIYAMCLDYENGWFSIINQIDEKQKAERVEMKGLLNVNE